MCSRMAASSRGQGTGTASSGKLVHQGENCAELVRPLHLHRLSYGGARALQRGRKRPMPLVVMLKRISV